MDYQLLKEMPCTERNLQLLNEIDEEKQLILKKYALQCNADLYWERPKDKYPQKIFFSHKFLKKSSTVRIVFYIYQLCFAKVKYFEQNWADFVPLVHHWRDGFVECEDYNMEFLRHKYSGIIFDLRDLQKITRIEDFRALCAHLDEQKRRRLN